MKYIYFLIGIIFYAGFAFDIEVDRDVGTWFWLLISVYFFFNSYLHYKKDTFGIPKMENPPPPPIAYGNCYKDCGNTIPSPGERKICLNCGSSIRDNRQFPAE